MSSAQEDRFWISLVPRGDRDVSASQFIDRIRPKLAKAPGIVLYLRAGQDINLSSGPSRSQYQYVLKSNDGATLNTWTQRLTEKLRSIPAFRDISNDLQLGLEDHGIHHARHLRQRGRRPWVVQP